MIFTLIIMVLGIIACKNSNSEDNTKNNTVKTDTLANVDKVNITTSKNDIIKYNDTEFPIDSTFTTKVLTVGVFHGDEVLENADRETWFGLFQGKQGFYIAETKLKTKRVNDAIIDENEEDKTGWEVQTVNKDTSIILIEKLSFLTPRNVQQVVLSKEQVFPDDTLRITYLGIDYKIFATGSKKKLQNEPDWFEVWNYKLYLTAIINGKAHKSLLVAQPNFDGQMIELIFAGDIDGDGVLDLIIDTSNHYNVTSPTIYLSKPAKNGEIVKPIGGHTSVGC